MFNLLHTVVRIFTLQMFAILDLLYAFFFSMYLSIWSTGELHKIIVYLSSQHKIWLSVKFYQECKNRHSFVWRSQYCISSASIISLPITEFSCIWMVVTIFGSFLAIACCCWIQWYKIRNSTKKKKKKSVILLPLFLVAKSFFMDIYIYIFF